MKDNPTRFSWSSLSFKNEIETPEVGKLTWMRSGGWRVQRLGRRRQTCWPLLITCNVLASPPGQGNDYSIYDMYEFSCDGFVQLIMYCIIVHVSFFFI